MLARSLPVALAAAILTTASSARAEDPPLFAAFKTFCADTGAEAAAIAAAVKTAGGEPHAFKPKAAGRNDPRKTLASKMWSVPMVGQAFAVYSTTQSIPAMDGNPKIIQDICGVSGAGDEKESLDALKAWVGFAPVVSAHTYVYAYQEQGGARKMVPDDHSAIYPHAIYEGGLYMLEASQKKTFAVVTLTRIQKAAE